MSKTIIATKSSKKAVATSVSVSNNNNNNNTMSKISASSATSKALSKRQANKASRLRKRLSGGIVEFDFLKKDGTIRHAFGTTLSNLVEDKINGRGTSGVTRGVVTFWDCEKSAWRSCRTSSIISIVPKNRKKVVVVSPNI